MASAFSTMRPKGSSGQPVDDPADRPARSGCRGCRSPLPYGSCTTRYTDRGGPASQPGLHASPSWGLTETLEAQVRGLPRKPPKTLRSPSRNAQLIAAAQSPIADTVDTQLTEWPRRPCQPVSVIRHSGHQGQGASRFRCGPLAAAVDHRHGQAEEHLVHV